MHKSNVRVHVPAKVGPVVALVALVAGASKMDELHMVYEIVLVFEFFVAVRAGKSDVQV